MDVKTGIIYQIYSNMSNDTFIGYTTNLGCCKYNHKQNLFNGKDSLLYNHIRNNGGLIKFNYRILKTIEITSIQELKNEYIKTIEDLKPSLNSDLNVISTITNDISFCIHGNNKYTCFQCPDECEHGKNRQRCKICKWNTYCRHNKVMKECVQCNNEKKLCIHNKSKRNCPDCNKDKLCIHDKFKYRCYYCRD